MLNAHPGRNIPNSSGNQSIRPDPPMANIPLNLGAQEEEVEAHDQRHAEVDKGDSGADTVPEAGICRTAVEFHHGDGTGLVAELEWQSCQGETEETGDDQQMHEDVNPVESAILLVRIRDGMVGMP